jgi:mRNA interferase RelE/StbE
LAYNIVYKKSIHRDLKRIPKPELDRLLHQIEAELAKRAEAYPMLKGRFAGLRKYRSGDYRVVYAILGNDVLVLRIGHRKDIYKREIK